MRHAAKLENSPRLKKVLDVLKDGAWHTTLDIALKAMDCAVHTTIDELRANGLVIESRRVQAVDGTTRRTRYEYQLISGDGE